jgi:SOS response regulatory protein OraA/RecX
VPTVTALHGRPRGRLAVELDGRPWRVLPAGPVLRAGLAAGVELDRERALRLRRELRRSEGLALAARALRTRDLSARRLAERLERGAVAPPERAAVLETVVAAGLVDDERFAERRAAALAERGYGDAAIDADLERQGIAANLRREAIEELPGEAERAAAVVARRGTGPRTARFLAARGFGEDAIEAAADARFANGP